MKVVILCGGKGTRLREETEVRPKPMVEIGGRPILWHIMKTYSFHGYRDFILCLGYKGEIIRSYFNEKAHGEDDWNVTMVDTGLEAMTGARVKRIEPYIEEDHFMLTYGDGVTDLDIEALVCFHMSHRKVGTVTGVFPRSIYGELHIEGDRVRSFDEKPAQSNHLISGGYFVFNKTLFSYLDDRDSCVLEKDALRRLANDEELNVYRHEGFWQCMDTYRDYAFLQDLWKNNRAAWKKWQLIST